MRTGNTIPLRQTSDITKFIRFTRIRHHIRYNISKFIKVYQTESTCFSVSFYHQRSSSPSLDSVFIDLLVNACRRSIPCLLTTSLTLVDAPSAQSRPLLRHSTKDRLAQRACNPWSARTVLHKRGETFPT